MGFLGKEVNDTKVWAELSQTLAEAGKELKMVLHVIKLDKKEMRGKYGKGVGSWRQQEKECTQGEDSCERTEHDPALETRWT